MTCSNCGRPILIPLPAYLDSPRIGMRCLACSEGAPQAQHELKTIEELHEEFQHQTSYSGKSRRNGNS